jgi:RHS repeat-associated protein
MNTLISNSFVGRLCLLAVGCWLWRAPGNVVNAAVSDPDLAARISGTPVLYQQLMWVGSTAPGKAENQALLTVVTNMTAHGVAQGLPAMEWFLASHPNSPWVPSLHANLARYYREHGRYTLALRYWESAWDATHEATEGPAKQVADFTFAYWTSLLASLGRMDTLTALFQETRGRVFGGGALQQVVNGTKEGYQTMLTRPDICFKCGTFALSHVAKVLKGSGFDTREIELIPSPTTGFSMTKLVEVAESSRLGLVAADCEGDKTLVVPSVVHWRQDHYAAIIELKEGRYKVVDPTFGQPRWLTASDINEEASGQFLVPKDKLPKDWDLLAGTDTDRIFGRGFAFGIGDGNDTCSNGSGGGGGGGDGGGGDGGWGWRPPGAGGSSPDGDATCLGGTCGGGNGGGGSCCIGDSGAQGGNTGPYLPPAQGPTDGGGSIGMPRWSVSEPYISVWLYDEPVGYQPGVGERVSFKLAYKQRETTETNANLFSLGPMWDCSWLSYVTDDEASWVATLYMAGGGEQIYLEPNGSQHGYLSRNSLARTPSPTGTLTNFILAYPSGAKDYYSYIPTNFLINALPIALLSDRVDAYGHTNHFVYQQTSSLVLLQYVVDTDGRTNTVSYTNTAFPSQITGVTDPFGRSAVLKYDSTGMLTNVTDPVGISSSFVYDGQDWITNMTTPYGTTTFSYYTNYTGLTGDGNEFGFGTNSVEEYIVRSVRIVDPALATNVYMIRQNSDYLYDSTNGSYDIPLILDANYTGLVPTNVPGNQFITTASNYRNSFWWGPRQAGELPADLTNLTVTNYVKARMRHWRHDGSGGVSQFLGMQQAPSPDGIHIGQTTWYDYDGQEGDAAGESAMPYPAHIGRILPDGTTWYTVYTRNDASWGHATNVVDTYSAGYGATPLTRTNVYAYDSANDIDLIEAIGPKGEMVAGYGYDSAHDVLSWTNAVGDVTSYTYDSQGRLTSTHSPAGLTTTNSYFASGTNLNWVQTRIDLEISRTNSFTYRNDLVYTHTDERGLTTTNLYDNLQRLTSSSDPRGTLSCAYNNLDPAQVVDRLGFTNSFGYDPDRRRTAATNALGNYTIYTYCTCGSLEAITDPLLTNVTSFEYNSTGWLTNTTYPDGTGVSRFYSLLGQLTNSVDTAGHSVTNWFNNQGLKYAVSNAYGQSLKLALDIEDRATNTVDANGVSRAQTFDNLGRLTNRTYPDGGVESFGYLAAGLVAYTNQLTNATHYGYDAAMRKTAETNANSEVTRYGYDPAGDPVTLTDGKTQTTTWHYDIYGSVSNKVDAASNVILVYHYDADSRLTNRWSAAKTNTYYAYDAAGDLTNVAYPVSHSISLAYDADTRLTNMLDVVGTSSYAYDGSGQLLSEDGPWSNDVITYAYTARQRTSLSLQEPSSSPWTQSYGYDASKRLTNVTSTAGSFGYSYNPTCNLLVRKLLLPNAAYITNTYDSVARLLSTQLQTNGVNLDAYSYTYDVGNQPTQQVFTAGDFVNYTYDSISQLTSALGQEPSGGTNRLQEQLRYGYDAAHNLNVRSNNALVETFNVNSLNELTTLPRTGTLTVVGTTTTPATNVTVNGSAATLYGDSTFAEAGFTLTNGSNSYTAIAANSAGLHSTDTISTYLPGTNSYTYDLNGNLLNDGTRYFAYDDENELTSVWVTNAWRSDFLYDGKMRRRVRMEFAWQSSAWAQTNEVHYVYDGNLVIEERNTNTVPLIISYTRGNDLSSSLQGAGGIGGLLARTDHSILAIEPTTMAAHAYYHTDGNGNVTALVNALQVLVAKYLYDPYGNISSASGPLASANTYQFSSKECHQNSGLVYYLYRFYDSSLQRWVNRDPIGELGGGNLFAYVSNNPLDGNDAFGLDGCDAQKQNLANATAAYSTALAKYQSSLTAVQHDTGTFGFGIAASVMCGNSAAKGPNWGNVIALGLSLGYTGWNYAWLSRDITASDNALQQLNSAQSALQAARAALAKCQKQNGLCPTPPNCP